MRFRSLLLGAATALAVTAAMFAPLRAQPVPSNPPPYNIDLGASTYPAMAATGVPTQTLTAAVPNTYNSAQQNNLSWRGIVCAFSASGSSGSPSITWNLQGYDAATNSYQTMATASVTANATPSVMAVMPSIAVSSLPSGYVAAANLPLPRIWRSQLVVTGANTTVTAKVGCNYIK